MKRGCQKAGGNSSALKKLQSYTFSDTDIFIGKEHVIDGDFAKTVSQWLKTHAGIKTIHIERSYIVSLQGIEQALSKCFKVKKIHLIFPYFSKRKIEKEFLNIVYRAILTSKKLKSIFIKSQGFFSDNRALMDTLKKRKNVDTLCLELGLNTCINSSSICSELQRKACECNVEIKCTKHDK